MLELLNLNRWRQEESFSLNLCVILNASTSVRDTDGASGFLRLTLVPDWKKTIQYRPMYKLIYFIGSVDVIKLRNKFPFCCTLSNSKRSLILNCSIYLGQSKIKSRTVLIETMTSQARIRLVVVILKTRVVWLVVHGLTQLDKSHIEMHFFRSSKFALDTI